MSIKKLQELEQFIYIYISLYIFSNSLSVYIYLPTQSLCSSDMAWSWNCSNSIKFRVFLLQAHSDQLSIYSCILTFFKVAPSAGAVEYTDCTSVEG